jgi:hypothetical protein
MMTESGASRISHGRRVSKVFGVWPKTLLWWQKSRKRSIDKEISLLRLFPESRVLMWEKSTTIDDKGMDGEVIQAFEQELGMTIGKEVANGIGQEVVQA